MEIVAEIGMNHDGNFDLAYELIRQAKLSGADVAKFQFGWRDKPGEINQIDGERAVQLREWCDYLGIEMLASVINDGALDLVQEAKLTRMKVASRTVIDRPDLAEKVIGLGKETFVSLGMWEGEDWPFGPPSDMLHYIWCRSKYPTYPQDLLDVPNQYSADAYYGYSDHCHGISACMLAIGRGAQYVEKHFTLNKSSQVIRDHTLSATPEELRQLSQLGGEVASLVGVIDAKKG
jgi:N,N'-diacetyllegionaminate synthase